MHAYKDISMFVEFGNAIANNNVQRGKVEYVDWYVRLGSVLAQSGFEPKGCSSLEWST